MPRSEPTPEANPPVTAKQGCAWLLSLFRLAIRALALTSVVWILVVMASLSWVGHRNPTVAFLMFLPAWLWSIPLLVTLVPSLVFDTLRTGWMVALALLLYLGPYLGYGWGSGGNGTATRGSATVRVMTFNRGQSQGTSLQPFKNEWKPDFLVFQDSGGRAQGYINAEGYKEFTHGSGIGEFVVLSKFPILATEIIKAESGDPGDGGQRVKEIAGRFEIDWNGKKIVLYSVHFPTHRGMLSSERNGGFLAGVVGLPGTPWAQKRHNREKYWAVTLEQVRQLSQRIEKETLPVIVAGDFNNPPYGPFYGTITQHLDDSQTQEGQGYGYSFPGSTNNPLALFRPWLRIDYIFCSKAKWQTVKHVTEPKRGSQHRAVFAEFELTQSR